MRCVVEWFKGLGRWVRSKLIKLRKIEKEMSEFEKVNKLYHYTSFEAACKILGSKTLLFSRLSRLNDVNESFRQIYTRNDDMAEGKELISWKDIEGRYRQISFSIDKDNKPGFLILPMWAHYAEKGKGVCFVFDKDKIIEKFDKSKVWHDEIDYRSDYSPELVLDCVEEVEERHKEVFFLKDAAWGYEQEFRLVSHSDDITKLNISDSLKWIVLMKNPDDEALETDTIFNSAEYRALVSLCGNDKIVVAYGNLLGDESLVDSDGDAPI